MSSRPPDVNPFERVPLGRRIGNWLRWVGSAPRHLWQGYRSWSVLQRRAVVIMGILAGGLFAWFGGNYYIRKSNEMAVMRLSTAINDSIGRNEDASKIVAQLDEILAISPNDVRAHKYKIALESGEADPTDYSQVQLVYQSHRKQMKWDKLLREAERRLTHEPRDFQAHTIAAQQKLVKKDIAGAMPHIQALTKPHVNTVNVNFQDVAWALEILGNNNLDVSKLREFTGANIHKFIQTDQVALGDPRLQSMTLFLFSETMEMPKLPPDTYTAWPASRKVAEICLTVCMERGDSQTARQLAFTAPKFAIALDRMHAEKQISDEQKLEMVTDLENRTQRAWQFVLTKENKLPEAYYGLMMSYFRTGRSQDGIRTLLTGMEACGDDPRLLQMFANISMQGNGGLDAHKHIKAAAERNPNFPKYWLLAAQCAYTAGRRDLAFDALRSAQQAMPKDLDVMCMFAAFTSGTGYPERVLNHLATVDDRQVAAMPNILPAFTRALAEVGDAERLDFVLAQTFEVSAKSNNPQPAIKAAAGVLDASPANAEMLAKTAEFLLPVIDRWNIGFPQAGHLKAACLAKVCDLKDGPVDVLLAREAIVACERALAVDGNNIPTVTTLVLYRLIGDKDPPKAMSEASVLIDNAAKLTAEQAEVLAMLYNANEKPNEAVRAVLGHTQTRPTAGCWTQLALAYRQQGRTNEAQAALENAAKLTKSNREHQDYLKAQELLAKGRP